MKPISNLTKRILFGTISLSLLSATALADVAQRFTYNHTRASQYSNIQPLPGGEENVDFVRTNNGWGIVYDEGGDAYPQQYMGYDQGEGGFAAVVSINDPEKSGSIVCIDDVIGNPKETAGIHYRGSQNIIDRGLFFTPPCNNNDQALFVQFNSAGPVNIGFGWNADGAIAVVNGEVYEWDVLQIASETISDTLYVGGPAQDTSIDVTVDELFTFDEKPTVETFYHIFDDVLPVDFFSFYVNSDGERIHFGWATAGETDNERFDLYRRINGDSVKIAEVPATNNPLGSSYEYSVANQWDGRQCFSIVSVSVFGGVEFEGVACTDDSQPTTPSLFALHQNYPNPFNPSTTISYTLSEAGPVGLSVYDVLGREVVTLVNKPQVSGYYEVTFDGVNLPSGVYICRLETPQFSASEKMVLLK